MDPQVGGGLSLDRFRNYLLLLARMHVGNRARAKIDASDVVQETLLEAHRKRGQFRGAGDGTLAAWLRQMLAFSIADAHRALGRAKRDITRERSLEAALNDSSSRLENLLAAPHSSPSQRASRQEQLVRLADALAQLPEDQRQAVVRKHLQGETVAAIAHDMNRTETAVGGLLRRGMARLRELLKEL
jgi:RNA polymerase sigma-70 factor (ECF subfamily)